MKTHNYYLGKILLLLITIVLVTVNVTAQDHESKDNYTGNWEDATTWTNGVVPPTNIPWGTRIDIKGTVTKNSALDVTKDFTLNIIDTLIIYGDFDLNKDGNINIEPGAFLIVYGNFSSAKDIVIDLSSYLVVFGTFTLQQDASINVDPPEDTLLYTTGETTCVGGCGTANIGDEDDIFDNPDLDEIIEATSNFITPRAPTLCDGGSLVLSIRADGNNYQWFETSATGTTLSTEPTLTVSATGTYDVNFYIGGVLQSVIAVTVTSSGTANYTVSGVVTNESAIDAGDGEIDITVTGATDPIYDWSNGEITEDLSGLTAGDYTIEVEDGVCTVSETFSVGVGCTPPTITGTTPASRCGTGTVTLGATASAGTINWYNVATGGSSLGTGTSYTTASISVTTNYYVDATDGGCTTASRTLIVATVNSIPTPVISGSANSCEQAIETYTTPASVNTFTWAVTGGTLQSAQGSNSMTIQWNDLVPVGTLSDVFIVSVTESDGTCSDVANYSVTVNRVPETGPQYHISNDFAN